jgi:outer membrane protein assembly factor BamB
MLLPLLLFVWCRFCIKVRAADSPTASFPTWSGWGANFYNNRWASQNSDISSSSILSLASHCLVSYPLGVSATPVVFGDNVYYPTWNGSFVALDYTTCQVLWKISVTDIVVNFAPISQLQANVSFPVSRTSPQIDGEILFFGTQLHALVVAVNRLTGQTLGAIQINSHPVAIVTQSPTFYNGVLFVGSSSLEEDAALLPGYVCCSFVGK